MRTITIATMVGSALALTACENIPFTPQSRIKAAKAEVAAAMPHVEAVRWSDVKAGPDGSVCGQVHMEVRVESKAVWSGPHDFVWKAGQPAEVTKDRDCEGSLRTWSRCVHGGDDAKVDAEVMVCKVEQRAGLALSPLISTDDLDRDQASFDAYLEASGIRGGAGNRDLETNLASAQTFEEVYNARIGLMPAGATPAQRIAVASAAADSAKAASDAVVNRAGGG